MVLERVGSREPVVRNIGKRTIGIERNGAIGRPRDWHCIHDQRIAINVGVVIEHACGGIDCQRCIAQDGIVVIHRNRNIIGRFDDDIERSIDRIGIGHAAADILPVNGKVDGEGAGLIGVGPVDDRRLIPRSDIGSLIRCSGGESIGSVGDGVPDGDIGKHQRSDSFTAVLIDKNRRDVGGDRNVGIFVPTSIINAVETDGVDHGFDANGSCFGFIADD